MHHTIESDSPHQEPAAQACLERTRSAVLNVLVGVGLTIAIGGWLLQGRAAAERPAPPRGLHDSLMLILIGLAVASYIVRRGSGRRVARLDSGRRESAFFWSHVLAAAIAAPGAALGIVYGWWVDPRLEAVIPFWVVPLALGFLAVPRSRELDDFDRPAPGPGAL
jgi:hypothetical protein